MDHAYFKQRIKKRLLCAEGRQPSHYLKCQYLDKKEIFVSGLLWSYALKDVQTTLYSCSAHEFDVPGTYKALVPFP